MSPNIFIKRQFLIINFLKKQIAGSFFLKKIKALHSPVEAAALLALGLEAPSKASREIGVEGEHHLF